MKDPTRWNISNKNMNLQNIHSQDEQILFMKDLILDICPNMEVNCLWNSSLIWINYTLFL